VSFIDRTYPDIVRDVLTNLTQGITGEAHPIDYDPNARPVQVPDLVLLHRPVKRVSTVQGFIPGAKPDDLPLPYSFTLNDYELAIHAIHRTFRASTLFPSVANPRPALR